MIALANALTGHAKHPYKIDAYETDAADRIRGKGDFGDENMPHDRILLRLHPDFR